MSTKESTSNRESRSFLVEMASALHHRGLAAPRLETALSTAGARLGEPLQLLATPTALQMAFGEGDGQRVVLVRQDPGEVDLARISALDETLDAVVGRQLSPNSGRARLLAIESSPPAHGPVATTLAFGLASGTAARLFGGSIADVVTAAALAAGVGLAALLSSRREGVARVFEPAAALAVTLVAGLIAAALAAAGVGIAPDVETLAAIIVLLPGFTVTVAMSELAERHLAAGSARLFGAGITFLSLGLGVGLGQALLRPIAIASPEPVAGALWSEVLAVVLTPLAFGVLFQARPRHFGWIAIAAVAGYFAARAGAVALGPELGTFCGALVVGLVSHLISRSTRVATIVTQVPGIMLLVPGSIGFRSLSAFLADDALSGTEIAFQMALSAAALAGGLLFAHVLLPPRRYL